MTDENITIYRIESIDTGEVHEGTSKELAAMLGVTRATITKAALDRFKVHRCWTVVKVKGPNRKRDANVVSKGVCQFCGNKFIPIKKMQTFCSSLCCRQYSIKSFQEELKENKRIKEGKSQKPRKKPKQSVTEIAVAARQAGMTYGQYVAKMGL